MVYSKIKIKIWAVFLLLSALSIAVWFRFTYPQLAFINYTISRQNATTIAQDYLKNNYPYYQKYNTAAIFGTDQNSDQFLQKTLGFEKMKSFTEENDFEIFYWLVRFFKENEKEEFLFGVSAKTGEITSFKHTVEESAEREHIEKAQSNEIALAFLKKNFAFDLNRYTPKADLTTHYDNRDEYFFSWQKESVKIPWTEDINEGTGKLTTSANVSGREILSFSKNTFIVPDEFGRDLAKRENIGHNLTTVVRVFYYILLIASVYFIYVRRNHLAMHSTKRFYFYVTLLVILLSLAGIYNEYQSILFSIPTTTDFKAYTVRYCINSLIAIILLSMSVFIPSLSGELLYNEVKSSEEKKGCFFHYIRSTFFSRSVFESILLGYMVCIIMLGIQSFLVKIGQQYLGVWTEYAWIDRVPTATLPFLAAFSIGYKASVSEELMYRLFAINWGRKLFKNTFIAALISSLIWGFAHSSYPVFPMWFRGFEVTVLGLFLSWVYLRFGLISVIVAHFLFDVFWCTSGYLLGQSQHSNMIGAIAILLIPLFFALIAFLCNKPEICKPLRWQLNRHQLFNLNVLTNYLINNHGHFEQSSDVNIRKEIIAHGWDIAVVDLAVEEFRKKKE